MDAQDLCVGAYIKVACRLKLTVVITTAGRVWTCGWGFRGRLRHGKTENKWDLTRGCRREGQGARGVTVRRGGRRGGKGSGWGVEPD